MTTNWNKLQNLSEDKKIEKVISWMRSPRSIGYQTQKLCNKICNGDEKQSYDLYYKSFNKYLKETGFPGY